ncbi:glycosyl hydrolase family 28-related protein [Kribbella sp. NPDC055071]
MRHRPLAIAVSLLLAIPLAWTGLSTVDKTPAEAKRPRPNWTSLSAQRTFPANNGMLNVKTVYGAVGDGIADDTAAIQAAISANIRKQDTSRILYFPQGTYRVTKPLFYKDTSGLWQSEITLQGDNQGKTTIQLSDNNPLFQNTSEPNSVIHTASLEPSSGDAGQGGGNNGFDNYIFDLTVNTGKGNPGANAVSFLGNNYCGLRNVTLRSGDPNHIGVAGLAMIRYATGPCLMKNVTIDGFQYGVRTSKLEYSVTFENLALSNQLTAGILNTDNVLSIRNLSSNNRVPAIQNFSSTLTGQSGLVTLIGAQLTGGSNTVSAIQNYQTLYARDVSTTGYKSALSDAQLQTIPGASIAEYTSGPVYTQFGGGSASLKLPIVETPEFEETDQAKMVDVTDYGADKTGAGNSSPGVQAAIAYANLHGATTIYFPAGKYTLNDPIQVSGGIRMIQGFDSKVVPGTSYTTTPAPGTPRRPLFVFNGPTDVIVDHIRFGNGSQVYPGLVYLQHDSSGSVTIRNTVFDRKDPGHAYQNGVAGTGDLFIEDVCGAGYTIGHPQRVFARQFNAEGPVQKVINLGGTLWILGMKTERISDVGGVGGIIDTESGGKTELLGALLYPVEKLIPTDQISFLIRDSKASFIYANSVHNPVVADPAVADGDVKVQIREIQQGVTRDLTSVAVRALTPRSSTGTMMPLYTSKP